MKIECPWIIRFTFNKELMMDKGIVMEDIYIALMEYDIDKLEFIYSDDNSSELIGRVSIKAEINGKLKMNNLMVYQIKLIYLYI